MNHPLLFSTMNMIKKWTLAFFATLLLIFPSQHSIAQSLTGPSGLVTIPTAEIQQDGKIAFGLNWLNKRYLVFEDNVRQYHGIAPFMTLGYLPFLEISLRLTRSLNYPEPEALGDRVVNLRFRLLPENRSFPSVVIGAHDAIGESQNFHAFYLSASKNFHLTPRSKIGFHLGYGSDYFDADRRQFVGIFGGISLSPHPFVRLMLEYDTEKFNFGTRLSLFDRVELLIALLNVETFSGGVSYRFQL